MEAGSQAPSFPSGHRDKKEEQRPTPPSLAAATMSMRPALFTRGLSGLSQSSTDASSPADQRDDAKRNFLKTMRPLPTQHYWHVYFDRFVGLVGLFCPPASGR